MKRRRKHVDGFYRCLKTRNYEILVGRDSVAITRVQIYQITRWVCKSISLEARCMVIMCSSVPFLVPLVVS
jgi:hypothetical protein